MDELVAALVEDGTAVLCRVLSGVGGVGKTQLAARYARLCWSTGQLDALVWLTAGNRESIVAQYARAAALLAAAEPVPTDPEEAARTFMEWLASTARRWLVVLDDLADPGDLKGLWPPDHPTGRAVVTTRRRDAALGGVGQRRVDVEAFTADEAVAYVAAKLAAHGRDDNPDQVRALARELGFLPIALAQAVTYLLDADLDCAGYRERWADRRRTLAKLVPRDGGLPDDQSAGLDAVWSLSVQRANALEPVGLAGPMLELASLLDPNGIPLDVLTAPPVLRYLTAHRTQPAAQDTGNANESIDSEDAKDALAALARLSLCTVDRDNPYRAVRVHAVLQRATRESLTRQQRTEAARAAANALVSVWPTIERDSDLTISLRGNTENLDDNARDALWGPNAHTVLFLAGNSLGESGLVAEAAAFYTRLRERAIQRLGPDHAHALVSRANLALWQAMAGDPAGGAAVLEELLADRVRILGTDDVGTLNTRHNLAYLRSLAGDVADAAAALEELFRDCLRVLGPDHHLTLATRASLAHAQGEAGDAAGAAAVLEELFRDCLRVMGPDDPDTLVMRHNLAFYRRQAGDAEGAADAFAEVLADRLRILGPDHPRTLVTRGNLARSQAEAGDLVTAAATLEELLADDLRILGPDHPETLTIRHNLAFVQGRAGDAAGAAAATEAVLADRLRILGPNHPEILVTRYNLARWRGEAGDPAGAAAAAEALLAAQVRILGPLDPQTLDTASRLAHWRREAKRASPDS